MADTIRTKAALLTLLADNTSGDISPQDVRDFLVSVHGVYGSIYTVDGAATQALNTTPAKLTLFAVDGTAAGTTPSHANDQITVLTDGVYQIVGTFSVSGIDTYTYQLRVNVDAAEQAIGARFYSNSTYTTNIAFSGQLSLTANEVVTVYGESTDAGGGQNLTLYDGNLMVYRIS